MPSDDGLPEDEGNAGGVNCREVIHRIYHYLDGELTSERRVTIQHHLDGCGSCLEAFDFEAELRLVIARKCRDEVPPTLRERIAKSILHESGGGEFPDFRRS